MARAPRIGGTGFRTLADAALALSVIASVRYLTNESVCSSVSGPPSEAVPQTLIEQIIQFKVANAPETPNQVPAPACLQQGPFSFNGQTSQFPHVVYEGK